MRPDAIPYYEQTADFSCGAAALVMALHALRDTPVTRRMEFEVWRDGTTIGTRGMDQWGLAVAALERDVPATVIAENDITFPGASDLARERFTDEELELAQFAQQENRDRAKRMGVQWEIRAPTPADVGGALQEDRVPILLVDLYTLSNGAYAAPHWVVVAEASPDGWVLHDPDDDGPGVRKLSQEEVWRATDVSDYLAKPTLVLLGP